VHRIAVPWGRVPGAQARHHPALSLPTEPARGVAPPEDRRRRVVHRPRHPIPPPPRSAPPAAPTRRAPLGRRAGAAPGAAAAACRPSSRHLRALGAPPGPSWPRHHRRRPLPDPASCRHTVFARPPRSGGPAAGHAPTHGHSLRRIEPGGHPCRPREMLALRLFSAGRMRGHSRGRSDGHRSVSSVPGHGTATNGRTRRGTVVPIRRGSVEGRVPLPSRHTA